MGRSIALFVEGDSECGEARRKTLPLFFHKWLDPQLRRDKRVGIHAIKFQGVSNYLDDLAQKVQLVLDTGKANYVVGIVDLYGIPQDRIDLRSWDSIDERVGAAKKHIIRLVPSAYRNRFSQHFAVHEVEAWLLAYPDVWPASIRSQIRRCTPENVNSNEPPAKFLKRLLGGTYKKTSYAKNLFPKVDPQAAIDCCPNLKKLADDLLKVAMALQ